VASLALAGCGDDGAERVSEREQRQLPTEAFSLVEDLCFRGDSPVDRTAAVRAARRRAPRQFNALERSLRRNPDATVRVRFALAESPDPETEDMSVRELAETHLEAAGHDVLPNEASCYRRGQARLERALAAAE